MKHWSSKLMSNSELMIGIIFALQTGVGILGNTFLLSCYIFVSCTGQRLKDIDLILNNLIFANCLVLLSKGITQTMLSLGLRNFLDDLGCKLVFYLHRVARGVSLGATSILSCFQAIKIVPSSPGCVKVKTTPVKHTRFSIICCWTLHMLLNSSILNYITGPRESNNHTETLDFGYCSGIIPGRRASSRINSRQLHSALYSCIDVLSLGCMVCASGFMMLILYKHKQNVLYIHRNNRPPKFSAETRATQSILILAGIFFCSYSLSSFFTFYMSRFEQPSRWLVNTSSLIAASFPCLSPFVLISRDPRVSRLCFTFCAKIHHFCQLIIVL